MDFNVVTSKNSPRQTQLSGGTNLSKQRLRRKLMSMSRDIRELKEATGEEITLYVETKDKKLFCVTGQHRVQDMRARHASKVDLSDNHKSSEIKTLGQVVDQEEKSDPQWIKSIENMGAEELELYKMSLLEVKKGMDNSMAKKSNAAGGSFDDTTIATVGGGGSCSTADRDGSATASVSGEHRSGTGPRRMKRGSV